MEQSYPIISIIIPTYNRAELLIETLQSVREQYYKNYECIIVDDFSTDDTFGTVNKFSITDGRFLYVENTKTKGAPGARNTGLEMARGEYVTFLDSDDTIASTCLSKRLSVAKKHNAEVTIGLQRVIIDGEEKNLVNIDSEQTPLIRFFSYMPNCDIPWINNSLLKTSFLKKHKIYWNESIKKFQDIQFNLEILIHQPKIYWTTQVDSKWIHRSNVKSIGKSDTEPGLNLKNLILIYDGYYRKAIKIKLNNLKNLKKQYKSAFIAISHSINYSTNKKDIFCKHYIKIASDILSPECVYLLTLHNKKWKFGINIWKKSVLKLIRIYLSIRNPAVIRKGYFQAVKEIKQD